MKKIILFLIIIVLCIVLIGCDIQNQYGKIQGVVDSSSNELKIVPTMSDEINNNSAWCATFQLVWNDMKNEVVKQDITFVPEQLKIAENLNKEEFKEEMISDSYYYKKFGLKTLELKSEIEKGIKDKFNETSDIIDKFDWSEEALNDPNNPNVSRYFFYTMLKRNFEFPKKFSVLPNGTFAQKYDNIKYFGIDKKTDETIRNQVRVLFYNSSDDYAVLLKTKDNDEIILYKNKEGKTFNEVYDSIIEKTNLYSGRKTFSEKDGLKIPNVSVNILRNYSEFENKIFYAADGDECEIQKAMQTIQFELDEKGGKIKSEAAIDMVKNTAIMRPEDIEPRYFYFDDTFTMFIKEIDKDVPYFALRIEDITLFQ